MFSLHDDDVALILKHLPRHRDTTKLLTRLAAYYRGYEYETSGLVDGHRLLTIYKRGVVQATVSVTDDDNLRDIMARMGYPNARKRG